MKRAVIATSALLVLASAIGRPGHASDAALTPMPPALETRLALSALPVPLRDAATVHVLDPASGYRVARAGSSGVECLVQRTAWELAELRDDLYIPLCYDAAGARTYLRVIIDVAALRAQGLDARALEARIEQRYADGTYRAPRKSGVSYMIAPVMRTVGPPDMSVHTMSMPHFMFYAPGVGNADLGARPDLAEPASLQYPFVDRQGNDAQSYIIQMVGESEKAAILAEHRGLLRELCTHREVLCLARER
ncbi:MAG: hypothetical protein EOP90_15035 [Lysobacteraceae bacterium]|nr:MAG: hypothetical protein EOP90_15035 [Xanthomonadaceae bacterium]